jgi:hypothetical protein
MQECKQLSRSLSGLTVLITGAAPQRVTSDAPA